MLLVLALLPVAAVAGAVLWVGSVAAERTHTVADVPARPVAVVFGAGLEAEGRPPPFLAMRLDVAAALLREGKVRVVLVSGDNRTRDYDEPTAMLRYLVAAGVPEDRVVRDYAGRNTYDTCARALRVFGVSSAVLVTQDYHLPRALAACHGVGMSVVGVPDTRARQVYPGVVDSYRPREYLADVKLVLDLVTGRDPVLGPPESAVTDALAGTG